MQIAITIFCCLFNFLSILGMNQQQVDQLTSNIKPLKQQCLRKLPLFFCSNEESNTYLHGEVTTHVLGWSLEHASYVIEEGDEVTGCGFGFFADKKSWFELYDGGKVGVITKLKFDPRCKARSDDKKLFGQLMKFFKEKKAEKIVSYVPLAQHFKTVLIQDGFSETYAMKYQTRFTKMIEKK